MKTGDRVIVKDYSGNTGRILREHQRLHGNVLFTIAAIKHDSHLIYCHKELAYLEERDGLGHAICAHRDRFEVVEDYKTFDAAREYEEILESHEIMNKLKTP